VDGIIKERQGFQRKLESAGIFLGGGEGGKMANLTEPLSEDDYPDDRIVSSAPFELEGDNISLNYIKEENQDFFRPLNVQIESSENKAQSGNTKND